MTEEAKKKIIVEPATHAKIKEWIDAGRKVYRFLCPHLSCLTEYFTPNLGTPCPNHAWKCGGDKPESEITLADLHAEQRWLEPVKFKDLQFYWRESNQLSIIMEVPGCARPFKVQSFGYIGGMMGLDRESYRDIKRECGSRKPTKWVTEAKASGALEDILNKISFTLGERRPA